MYSILGNVRVALRLGGYARKIGRGNPSASELGGAGGPRSYSSQEYVSVSPSGSLATAVKENGVLLGITTSLPALTVGIVFPVGTEVPHTETMGKVPRRCVVICSRLRT